MKISDCRAFSLFKTLPGCWAFRHSGKKKTARELWGHSQGNFMQASIGLSYLSSITSHFLNVLHWTVFDIFLLHDNESDLKVAMRCSTQFQRVVECCQHMRKHIANIFQNNNSASESVSNRLRNLQYIFQRIFSALLTYLLCWVFANRVTYRLTRPTETAIRRLVSL